MKEINIPNKIVPKQVVKDTKYRWSKYCVMQKNETGDYIIRNFINDGCIVVNRSEFKTPNVREYMIKNYYVVPEGSDESSIAKSIRTNTSKKSFPTFEKLGGYTIMTTLDCNARCYYCYECGRTKSVMSEETANDVADYIIRKYNGKSVKLGWFGGEPLYNEKVINIIINRLKEAGINYHSSMISNGYLFEESKIDTYKNDWKLQRVQITLDGVGEVYNRIKNFIYEGNPYEKVMKSIDILTSNGIRVVVRLNLSSMNKEDLLAVIKECTTRFKSRKTFSIYAHNVFDEESSSDEQFLETIYQDLSEVNQELLKHGYGTGAKVIKPSLQKSSCMANSGHSVVITPTGQLTLCEHHSEDEIIGDIYNDLYNIATIKSWDERFEVKGLCEKCPLYPSCYMLKKCAAATCNKYKKGEKIHKIKLLLKRELKKHTN